MSKKNKLKPYVAPRPVENLLARIKLEEQYLRQHPVAPPKVTGGKFGFVSQVDREAYDREVHRLSVKAIEWAKKRQFASSL